MQPLLAFNEDMFRDVLRAFDNLEERANEKALSLDCAYERVRDTRLDVVNAWYMTNFGIDLASLEAWAKVDELRLVANSVKHGEGTSAQALRLLRPDLFQDPAFADIQAEMGGRWFDRRHPLAMPLAGEDLFVTESDLHNYCTAAVALFNGIVEFCETFNH
jgi:hypothetical protein